MRVLSSGELLFDFCRSNSGAGIIVGAEGCEDQVELPNSDIVLGGRDEEYFIHFDTEKEMEEQFQEWKKYIKENDVINVYMNRIY
jgi:hypothetical protein